MSRLAKKRKFVKNAQDQELFWTKLTLDSPIVRVFVVAVLAVLSWLVIMLFASIAFPTHTNYLLGFEEEKQNRVLGETTRADSDGSFLGSAAKTIFRPFGYFTLWLLKLNEPSVNALDPLSVTDVNSVFVLDNAGNVVVTRPLILKDGGSLDKVDWDSLEGKPIILSTINGVGSGADVKLVGGDNVDIVSNKETGTITISTTPLAGTSLTTTSNVSLSGGAGISIAGTSPDFTITNTNLGSSQNIFKNIAVASQSTISADSNSDTLNFAAGSGITLATSAGTDTLTISSTGGGNADTLDSLDSTQFLRSDTSDSFTSGTLTLAAGTTLSILGSLSCTNCVGDSAVVDTITVAAAGITGSLTDAQVSDTITVSNYLPLAGGTLTGSLTLNDNDGTGNDVNLVIGDSDETGNIQIFNGGFTGTIAMSALGSAQTFTFPATGGTICISGVVCTADDLIAASSVVSDAEVDDNITISSAGSIDTGAINSGTLGNAGVTLALGSFGSITGSLGDANVADTITASNYLPLAGGTMSGDIDSNTNLILNIGSTSTDFTAGGGLNIATNLDVSGSIAVGDGASNNDKHLVNAAGEVTSSSCNFTSWIGGTGCSGLRLFPDYSSSTSAYLSGLEVKPSITNTAAATLAAGIIIRNIGDTSSGDVTNAYGLYFFDDFTTGTTANRFITQPSGATATNVLANTSIGTGTDPTVPLDVSGSSLFTLGASNNLTIDASTTANTTTTGVLDLNVTSSTDESRAIDLSFTATPSSSNDAYGFRQHIVNDPQLAGPSVSWLYGQYMDFDDANSNVTTVNRGYYVDMDVTGDLNGTKEARGFEAVVLSQNSTDQGTRNTFGGFFTATGSTNGTSTVYGVYASAAGGDNNYHFYMGAAPRTSGSAALCWDNSGASDISDCASAPVADYAEIYPTEDNVEYGDLVVLGEQLVETEYVPSDPEGNPLEPEIFSIPKLSRSQQPYHQGIIGVVSQNYMDFSSIGHGSVKEGDKPMPVALVGRVPVKVSAENGPIAPGNPLTSSSIPGAAMKATKSGPMVGKALQGYSGSGVGTIMMFVNVGWYVAPIESGQDGGSSVSDISVETLTADSIQTDVLIIDGKQISLNKEGRLQIDGDVQINGDLLVAGKIAAEELSLGDESSGVETVKTGTQKLEVKTNLVKEESKIFVTFTGDYSPATRYWTTKKTGESFTVHLDQAVSSSSNFSWLIIN